MMLGMLIFGSVLAFGFAFVCMLGDMKYDWDDTEEFDWDANWDDEDYRY